MANTATIGDRQAEYGPQICRPPRLVRLVQAERVRNPRRWFGWWIDTHFLVHSRHCRARSQHRQYRVSHGQSMKGNVKTPGPGERLQLAAFCLFETLHMTGGALGASTVTAAIERLMDKRALHR